MKKRIVRRSKRRVSSRKPVSKTGSSLFDNLRESIGRRREFVFLLLILVVGMLVFDIIGYDYTGLVIENNAISGAQTAGIPDTAISSIASTFQSIFKLLFGGFLSPILNAFENNEIIATRLTLFFILLFLILPIAKGIFKVKEGGNKVAANIVSVLISLLAIGLLPNEFVKRLSVSIPAILVILFILAVIYGMFKWKAKSKGESVIKGIMALVALLVLSYIMQGLSIGVSELSGAIWLASGIAFAILAFLFFYGVFYKPLMGIGGETTSFKKKAQDVADVKMDVRGGREVLAKSKEEGVASGVRRKAQKTIRTAETEVFNFIQRYGNQLGENRRTRGVIARVNEVISLLRNVNNPQIVAEVNRLSQELGGFNQLCSAVGAAPEVAEINQGISFLNRMRQSLNTLYPLAQNL
ncbi:hypothetical protein HY500_03200 [Candidatus Woesearchaeota archaeon]|nr:hypothetical protein [Candidatus Woesearchaeota archaeon]